MFCVSYLKSSKIRRLILKVTVFFDFLKPQRSLVSREQNTAMLQSLQIQVMLFNEYYAWER